MVVVTGRFELTDGVIVLAYGLYPHSRRRGLATRAVILACGYLAVRGAVQETLIRAHPDNGPSVRVAERAGFTYLRPEGDGELDRCLLRLGS
jgi:RimJ/RimL family protein N-acetyltransferase